MEHRPFHFVFPGKTRPYAFFSLSFMFWVAATIGQEHEALLSQRVFFLFQTKKKPEIVNYLSSCKTVVTTSERKEKKR